MISSSNPAGPRSVGPGFDRRAVAMGLMLAAFPFLSSSAKSDVSSAATLGGTLKERADRKGLLIGASLDFPDVKDPRFRQEAVTDYNCLVSENGFNWTRVQAQAGAPLIYDQADAVYDIAESTGAVFRLHDLHYDRTTPIWVKEAVKNASPAQAAKLLENHIRSILKVWGPRCGHINVVNEPEYGIGKPFRPDTFADKIGEEYIDIAFHTARECAPGALLFTNIAGVEVANTRCENARRASLKLFDRMLQRKVPVDAIGIEGHIAGTDRFDQAVYSNYLGEITSRGLLLMISEYDVYDIDLATNFQTRDEQSAQIIEAFLVASFENPKCIGACTWSPTDAHSWMLKLSNLKRGDGTPFRPGLLDTEFRRKAQWAATARALDQAAPRNRSLAVRGRLG